MVGKVVAETMHRWADAHRSPGFLQRLATPCRRYAARTNDLACDGQECPSYLPVALTSSIAPAIAASTRSMSASVWAAEKPWWGDTAKYTPRR